MTWQQHSVLTCRATDAGRKPRTHFLRTNIIRVLYLLQHLRNKYHMHSRPIHAGMRNKTGSITRKKRKKRTNKNRAYDMNWTICLHDCIPRTTPISGNIRAQIGVSLLFSVTNDQSQPFDTSNQFGIVIVLSRPSDTIPSTVFTYGIKEISIYFHSTR